MTVTDEPEPEPYEGKLLNFPIEGYKTKCPVFTNHHGSSLNSEFSPPPPHSSIQSAGQNTDRIMAHACVSICGNKNKLQKQKHLQLNRVPLSPGLSTLPDQPALLHCPNLIASRRSIRGRQLPSLSFGSHFWCASSARPASPPWIWTCYPSLLSPPPAPSPRLHQNQGGSDSC